MIEIPKDLESTEKSPFQEEIILENYFTGAKRGVVLSQMKEAMRNGATLMALTGEEGSGKTMMCRLLAHETSPLSKTVFFSQTVDSFEDVVKMIAVQLGVDTVMEMDGRNVDQILDQIIDYLLFESVDLLIVFDEAENIYLATLERIRKMLDRIIESGAQIHILFSGRPTFLENCDQLSLCDFNNNEHLHFALTPLSEVETADYLKDCAARLPGIDVTKVFADEMIGNIHTLAKGNFKKISLLGEESMKTPGDDTSFMVLLDSFKENSDDEEAKTGIITFSHLTELIFTHFRWIGGVVCCLLLLLFLYGRGDNEKNVSEDNVQDQKADITDTAVVAQDLIIQQPESNEPVMVQQKEDVQPQQEKVTAEQVQEGSTFKEETVPESVEKTFQHGIAQKQEEIKKSAVGPTEKVESEVGDEVGVTVVAETPKTEDTHEAVIEMGSILLLQSAKDQKKKLGLSLESTRLKIKAEPRAKIHKAVTSNSNSSVDQLFKNRLLAGSRWKRGNNENMYTVQLMALASINAEKNLKRLLAQDRYRQEAGNFYIFQNATSSENIIVFYGEYSSLERARLVKASLPEFLRDHKPYALSIKGAIAKLRK